MDKPGKRTIGEVDSYESDNGFVSNDDSQAPRSKKTKKAKPSSKATEAAANKFWALSSGRTPRRVEISEFKNMQLINIREFYEKDDAYLPGKKGISLTVEQYKAFLKAVPEINARLRDAGIDVAESAGAAADGDEPDLPKKDKKKKAKAKNDRLNIDATSDEED